jgi:hypothetical protein
MRTVYRLIHGLCLGLVAIGCSQSDALTTSGETESSSGTGTTDDSPTTNDPSAASNTGGESCTPGKSDACTCTNGDPGAQVCEADGKGYEPCVCEGGGSNSNSESDSTDPTTTGVEMTTTGVQETTTGVEETTTGLDTTDGAESSSSSSGGVIDCDDPGPEPNEVEAEAVALGDQNCQGDDGEAQGVLAGDADVDWFTYHAIDGMGCGFGDPNTTNTIDAGEAVRLCVYAECDMGQIEFECPNGAQGEDSPEGRPGCCGEGEVTFGFNCMGTMSESANIYVKVDDAPADSCVEYTLTYSFGG